MALKLLQPGLRPLGQFDLEDDDTVVGGEVVKLEMHNDSASAESRAYDASNIGPFSSTDRSVRFSVGSFEIGKLCGLADDGGASGSTGGYGTLFGHVIGGSAGQGVSVQLNTGYATSGSVVTVGPATNMASGKVTVWHSAGLYGVNGDALASAGENIVAAGSATVDTLTAATITSATHANLPVFARTTTGKLFVTSKVATTNHSFLNGGVVTPDAPSSQAAIYVGHMKDSSIVSTPSYMAGGSGTLGSAYSSDSEEYVIYFLGNQGLV